MAESLLLPQAKEWISRLCVVHWCERVAPGSFKTYYGFLVGFCKQLGKDPKELVAWTKNSMDKYDILDSVQKHILGLNGQRYAAKQIAYAAIRPSESAATPTSRTQVNHKELA